MTNQWQYTALHRAGDAVWRIALLFADDRRRAEHIVRAAFVRALHAPNASPDHELYRFLLRQRPRRQPLRRHAIPGTLRRIAPLDRVLLGLWLLHGYDAARLTAVSGLASATIADRLAQTLLVAADDPSIDPADRASFVAWLRGLLGIDAAVQGHGHMRWHVLIATVREQLHEAVGRERLPVAVTDAIEHDLQSWAAGDQQRWWHHPVFVIGGLIAGVAVVLLLLAEPWNSGATTAAAPLPTPHDLVATALDRWDDVDVADKGTLHRRVVAVDPLLGSDEPMITEMWLGSQNGRHRIEVRRGNDLVEWQIGDGRSRLFYAAHTRWNSCPWPSASILDSQPRSFPLPAEQQADVRNQRLMHGAYGVGYTALQAALAADDLRSFGVRRDGEHATLTLAFTDRQAAPERHLLLSIDAATGELRRVQQIIDGGAQATARDLWRVEVSEQTLGDVPLQQPPGDRKMIERDRLLDATCPALDDRHVVSLRTQAAAQWRDAVPYLPSQLPPGITRAAIVTTDGVNGISNQPIRSGSLLMIGPQRSISLTQMPGELLSSTDLEQRGKWRVRIEDRDGVIEGELCRAEAENEQCYSYLMLVARGWSYDDVLALIDTLQPTAIDTWLALDDAFLDPQPLSPDVKAVFQSSLGALQPQPGQTMHSMATQWQRIDPDRPHWNDPYHVALDILVPEHRRLEQWIAYDRDGSSRFRTLQTLPDGTILNAHSFDGTTNKSYSAMSGSVNMSSVRGAWRFEPPPSLSLAMLLGLLRSSLPVSMAQTERELVLEQPDPNPIQSEPWLSGSQAWWIRDLPAGTFVRRIVIDRTTKVPRRAELVHIADNGTEMPLQRTEISLWRTDATPTADVWSLPTLPDETITFVDQPDVPIDVEAALDFTPPTRLLAWPETNTIRIESRSPLLQPNTSTNQHLERILSLPLDRVEQIQGTGLIDTTRYRFENQPSRITIRQGDRDLLRRMLRHQWRSEPDEWARTRSSQPIQAVIAGQVRDGWRIADGTGQALIFEIDDLLLHVSGVPQVLGPALDQLDRLEWQDVGDRAP